MIKFVKMNDSDLRELKAFAAPIWIECYDGIVERGHTEMLIEKYFEYENILKFKAEGMIYEYILSEEERAGFIAYLLNSEYLYLDKLYLTKEQRGRHISRNVFDYLTKSFKLPIRLNVNRGNARAVAAYEANGFKIIKTEELPQKDGFVNMDYVMERDCNADFQSI